MHDFYGYDHVDNGKHLYQVMHPNQEISPQYIFKNNIRTKDADYICHRVQPFSYHGKDKSLRGEIFLDFLNITMSATYDADVLIDHSEDESKSTTKTPSAPPTFSPTIKPTSQHHTFSTGGMCTKNYLRILRMHGVDRTWQNQEWHEREDTYEHKL